MACHRILSGGRHRSSSDKVKAKIETVLVEIDVYTYRFLSGFGQELLFELVKFSNTSVEFHYYVFKSLLDCFNFLIHFGLKIFCLRFHLGELLVINWRLCPEIGPRRCMP